MKLEDKTKKNLKNAAIATGILLGTTFVVMRTIAKKQQPKSVYADQPEEQNPVEGKKVVFVENENEPENADGKCGHLQPIDESEHLPTFYEKYVKRGFDIVLSFGGLVVLSPIYAATALAIKADDPGPVIFKQKRVAQNKGYFQLLKFRSMSVNTPKDVPTHMLQNGGITKVGAFIRKTSIDELPQLWNIFLGNMSIIGPRPALWNQDYLTAERDKYGANDVKPGLTGLAQISGRDELEIEDKAKLDGVYAKELKKSSINGFLMDCKMFIGSISSVLRSSGVVEGGTGAIAREFNKAEFVENGDVSDAGFEDYGFRKVFSIDKNKKLRVLITGADSYIGTSFEAWAKENYPNLEIETVDMIDGTWREKDFSGYDAVFHVAGLAHADVGNVSDEVKQKYYAVNTDLAIETAEKAKADGVKQFVFMSSIIIYGDSAGYGEKKVITANTVPTPANFYGDSKWQADKGVRALASDDFNVAVIRPPMIYGRGSKGNYPTLAKLAKKLPVFPNVDNERSMLHIDNLCEFLCQIMLSGENGIYFPQNAEYTKTCDMVRMISHASEKNIIETKALNPFVKLGTMIPGKVRGLVNKAFGNLTIDQELSRYNGIEYIVNGLKESIGKTEKADFEDSEEDCLDDSLVSIIMPCYNCSEFISDTILSVINQTYKNWELIIVDDCSTDESIAKIEAYNDDRIKIFRNDKNSGAAYSRNVAIKNAKGRWIAFLDSDDIWTYNKLEVQLDYMQEYDKSFTCTIYGKITETGEILDKIIDNANIRTYDELLKNCPGNLTVMYDAKSLGKIYAYDIKRRNDYALWFKVIRKSGELSCVPKCLGYHRVRSNSISSDKTKLVKYHWHIYRNNEQLNIFKSIGLVIYWCLKGVKNKFDK